MKREDFKRLFDEHFDTLRNFLYYRSGDTDMATDVAQDVFLKIWMKQLDKQPEELVGLLYKMAKNTLISKYRHNQIEQAFIARTPAAESSQSPEEAMNYKELKTNYEQALSRMPPKQREVFLMSRYEELKYHEIAQRLELSIKAVEKRMKNALQFLREALAAQ
ncbi:RNA polymerase sigma-70 factor [Carboxylicivirga taeanensis]|uniref:RNA polymerase sigma-70 factor n=1 Tax=Carboxylicivirga taeanensis TaxID=1416875 RepID=UPI003F6DE1DF